MSYSQVFKIVPILVGALDAGREALYGQLLSKYLLSGENLFVVSSDFCHWGEKMDVALWVWHRE